MTKHLWQGRMLDDAGLDAALEQLGSAVAEALGTPVSTNLVLGACAALAVDLADANSATNARLLRVLVDEHRMPPSEAAMALTETGAFLSEENLAAKLRRELGSVQPLVAARTTFKETLFEQWAPLGLIVHLAPANAATVGPLSVVEGLLAGNVNALKISSKDGPFALALLDELGRRDASGVVARHIFVLRLGAKDARLARVMSEADGVAAWGGEEAVRGAKALAPEGARFIDWGPKISFTYATPAATRAPDFFARLAQEIVEVEQQACSSPQVAYFDTSSRAELAAFAQQLATALAAASVTKAAPAVAAAEQAEITNVVQLAHMETHLGLTEVLAAADGAWRVLVDHRAALRASPLYRTIWVKALPRAKIVATLRPMRRYLQTVGLEAAGADVAPLTAAFVAAGCLRVAPVGAMLASYPGEPHDGVYALTRYARRVSIRPGAALASVASFAQLCDVAAPAPAGKPILTKEAFQARQVPDSASELYFKSGGSSGQPKLSLFTYDDYHAQMRLAAHGLLAAGLDPARDVCMNTFFGGGLYGGFISFFSVLEELAARQLPMAAHVDLSEVSRAIIAQRVTVLLGMPSYILGLFEKHGDELRAYGGVAKVFYGGEHFSDSQRRRLTEEYGVKLIKSATYGSVDAGPLAYQCKACAGAVHHLHVELQTLEILELERDAPVSEGAVGRLVFSSHMRHGQDLARYDIGDLGRWVPGACACGIRAPRFELMGRHGDVFRIGSEFFNYRKIARILDEELRYGGEAQCILTADAHRERIVLQLAHPAPDADLVRRALFAGYPELRVAVEVDNLLDVVVQVVGSDALVRTPGSGKLRAVVDRRR